MRVTVAPSPSTYSSSSSALYDGQLQHTKWKSPVSSPMNSGTESAGANFVATVWPISSSSRICATAVITS